MSVLKIDRKFPKCWQCAGDRERVGFGWGCVCVDCGSHPVADNGLPYVDHAAVRRVKDQLEKGGVPEVISGIDQWIRLTKAFDPPISDECKRLLEQV